MAACWGPPSPFGRRERSRNLVSAIRLSPASKASRVARPTPPPQQARREKQKRANQGEHRANRDANQPQRQGHQPHNREENQRQQCYRPAQHEQNAPRNKQNQRFHRDILPLSRRTSTAFSRYCSRVNLRRATVHDFRSARHDSTRRGFLRTVSTGDTPVATPRRGPGS